MILAYQRYMLAKQLSKLANATLSQTTQAMKDCPTCKIRRMYHLHHSETVFVYREIGTTGYQMVHLYEEEEENRRNELLGRAEREALRQIRNQPSYR